MTAKHDRSEYQDLSIWHLHDKDIDLYLEYLEKKNNEWLFGEPKPISKEEEDYYIQVQTNLYFNIKNDDPRFDRYIACIRLRKNDHLLIRSFEKKLEQYAELFIRATRIIHSEDTRILMRYQDLYWLHNFKKTWVDTPRVLWIYIKSRVFILKSLEEYMAYGSEVSALTSRLLQIEGYQNKAFLEGIDYNLTSDLIQAHKEYMCLMYEPFEQPVFEESAEYKLYLRNGVVSFFRANLPLVPVEWIEERYSPDYQKALSIHAERNGKKPIKHDRSEMTKWSLP